MSWADGAPSILGSFWSYIGSVIGLGASSPFFHFTAVVIVGNSALDGGVAMFADVAGELPELFGVGDFVA